MENVKFVYSRKGYAPHTLVYVFKLSDDIADTLRYYTNYPDKDLEIELSKDNEVELRIGSLLDEDPEPLDESVMETIERISNSVDEETFMNHLLTENGIFRAPAEVHELMINEYGVKEDDEWWVAHFFIHLRSILFDPEYD